VNSRDVIRVLQKDGWYEINQSGSHKQFKHATKPGRVTVPHPKRDIPIGTLRSIENHSRVRDERQTGRDQAALRPGGKEFAMDYIAYLHKDRNSDYGVSFPDFPGCITAGKTLEEAHRMAAEALALHIAGMVEDGEEIPAPSTLDALAKDSARKDAVAFLVHVDPATERTVRINITAREKQVEEIDRLAQREGMTRSAYMVQASLNRIPLARRGRFLRKDRGTTKKKTYSATV